MKQYKTDEIRNVVLLGHGGTGKTSLSEAALFATGAVTRLGSVDEGTTVSDYEPDEIHRQISIGLSLVPCEWEGHKVNLIDTPGYAEFVGEVKAGIRAADAAAVVVCAVSGVEVGTQQVWGFADEAGLPRLVYVNRLDRENADFARTVGQIQAQFGRKCTPLQVPIGSQEALEGVVDLIEQKAYMGAKAAAGDIPESVAGQVGSYREQLIEAIAETNDELLAKYLEGEELAAEELQGALRAGICSGAIVPVLTGSATKNVAAARFLEAICSYLPAPSDRGEFSAKDASSGADVSLKGDPAGPLAALAFKTSAERVGKLTYLRVCSGTLAADSQVWNAGKGAQERIGQLLVMRGKNQEQVPQLEAGDIGVVVRLSETGTGDTLSSRERPLILEPIIFPEPSISLAVRPKTRADLDKLGPALARMAEEDPTLRIRRQQDTGETLLSGLGESHIEVAAERMKRKFGVDVELAPPKVPYRETITASGSAEYTHKKQTGGHGQYARVAIEIEPLPRGSGFEFAQRVVGGSVPRNYIPAVEKGVVEALQEGVIARYPLTDVKVTLFDGKDHPVDSSEICFKIAGAAALKKGAAEASPVLLEPIMNLRVRVPEANTGDVMSDLNSRRAKVLGMTPEDGMSVIDAQAPLAEIQRYATDLRSMTQGRGGYSVEFSHYEEVPAQIAQRIAEEAQKQEKG